MTVVLDTNILVSALTEYRDVLSRPGLIPAVLTAQDKEAICNYLAAHSSLHEIHFLWRTLLNDPKDDHILELAVAARADYIITRNLKDFGPAKSFGITAIEPAKFIQLIGGLP